MGEVWRSGITSNYTKHEIRETKIINDRKVDLPQRPLVSHESNDRKGIAITSTIASKGGGKTLVKFWFGTNDFRQIAEEMVRADPVAAKAAFESALENPNKTTEENRRKYLESELAKLK